MRSTALTVVTSPDREFARTFFQFVLQQLTLLEQSERPPSKAQMRGLASQVGTCTRFGEMFGSAPDFGVDLNTLAQIQEAWSRVEACWGRGVSRRNDRLRSPLAAPGLANLRGPLD